MLIVFALVAEVWLDPPVCGYVVFPRQGQTGEGSRDLSSRLSHWHVSHSLSPGLTQAAGLVRGFIPS